MFGFHPISMYIYVYNLDEDTFCTEIWCQKSKLIVSGNISLQVITVVLVGNQLSMDLCLLQMTFLCIKHGFSVWFLYYKRTERWQSWPYIYIHFNVQLHKTRCVTFYSSMRLTASVVLLYLHTGIITVKKWRVLRFKNKKLFDSKKLAEIPSKKKKNGRQYLRNSQDKRVNQKFTELNFFYWTNKSNEYKSRAATWEELRFRRCIYSIVWMAL